MAAAIEILELTRRYDSLVAVDHLERKTYVVGDTRSWVAQTVARLQTLEPLSEPATRATPVAFHLDRDHATYLADVAQALDWERRLHNKGL